MDANKSQTDIKKTSWEELWFILAKMSRESWFFNVDWFGLGRHFFSTFYTNDVWKWDYSKLLSVCRADGWPHVDENLSEEEFIKSIFKSFFWIDRLPQKTRYDLLCRVQVLIRDLSKRTNAYKAQYKKLEGLQCRTETEEYELRLIRHYIKKSQRAKDRICEYISDELDGEAILLSQRGFPWRSSIHKIAFIEQLVKNADKENCNDITNKFLDYPINAVNTIQRLYAESSHSFYDWAEDELKIRIIPKTYRLIKENHLLNERADMLNEGISLYENGKYQVASSVLALQIEGIIRDVLIDCGEKETSLRATSLTEKVDRLANFNVGFYSFEYYAFRFPVLRNEIAHGNAHNTQRKEAIMIMLDLCALCRYVATSDSLPCNKMIALMRRANEDSATEKDRIDYARFIVSHTHIQIPDFYGLHEAEATINQKIQKIGFWEELLKCDIAENKSIGEAIAEGDKIAKRFDATSQLSSFKADCKQKLKEASS